MKRYSLMVYAAILICSTAFGQQEVNLNEAIRLALQQNDHIKASELQVEYFKQLKKTSTDIGKLSASWMHGQYNSSYQDNNFTIAQSLPFPTSLASQIALAKEEVVGAQQALASSQNDLTQDVKTSYYQLMYLLAERKLLQEQDSLFSEFHRASGLRYKTGEGTVLERTMAEAQVMEVRNQLRINQSNIQITKTQLGVLLKSENTLTPSDTLRRREIVLDEFGSFDQNPALRYIRQLTVISKYEKRVASTRLLPDINVGYFNQSLVGYQNLDGTEKYYGKDARFQGFQLGLAFPLWFGPGAAKIRAASYNAASTKKNEEHFESALKGSYDQAVQEYEKDRSSLEYYENTALRNAGLILSQARKAYRQGEIGYIEYLQAVKSALLIKASHLQALNTYNQAVIKIEFLLGKS